MPPLPIVSSTEAIEAFKRHGWAYDRRESSHLTLIRLGSPVVLTVPVRRELPRGTLRKLIRLASMTVDEFIAAL